MCFVFFQIIFFEDFKKVTLPAPPLTSTDVKWSVISPFLPPTTCVKSKWGENNFLTKCQEKQKHKTSGSQKNLWRDQ